MVVAEKSGTLENNWPVALKTVVMPKEKRLCVDGLLAFAWSYHRVAAVASHTPGFYIVRKIGSEHLIF